MFMLVMVSLVPLSDGAQGSRVESEEKSAKCGGLD